MGDIIYIDVTSLIRSFRTRAVSVAVSGVACAVALHVLLHCMCVCICALVSLGVDASRTI